MDDEEERRLFQKNLPEFVQRIDPVNILPYLSCLSQQSRESITACQTNYGAMRAVQELQSRLIRCDGWYNQLMVALRDPEINQHGLAKLMEKPTRDKTNPVKCKEESKKVTPKTPYRDLPSTIEKPLRRLDCTSGLTSWKDLASVLGYTVDEVSQLEVRGDHGDSHTIGMLNDWKNDSNATLENLICALKKIDRGDIVKEVSSLTGYLEYLQQEIILKAAEQDSMPESNVENVRGSGDGDKMTKLSQSSTATPLDIRNKSQFPHSENKPISDEVRIETDYRDRKKAGLAKNYQGEKMKMFSAGNSSQATFPDKSVENRKRDLPVDENNQIVPVSVPQEFGKFEEYDNKSISVRKSKRKEASDRKNEYQNENIDRPENTEHNMPIDDEINTPQASANGEKRQNRFCVFDSTVGKQLIILSLNWLKNWP